MMNRRALSTPLLAAALIAVMAPVASAGQSDATREAVAAIREAAATVRREARTVTRYQGSRNNRFEQSEPKTNTVKVGANGLIELRNIAGDITVTAGGGVNLTVVFDPSDPFPSRLVEVAAAGTAVALFLAFIGRPLVVAAILVPFRYPATDIVYAGWVGLRGAVPIVLATMPVMAGVPSAERIFDVVFFLVVVGAILLTAVAGSALSIVIGHNVLRQTALNDSVHNVVFYASNVQSYVEGARSMLATTAELPLMRNVDGPRRVATLILAHSDVFEYLMLLKPGGTVILLEPHALEGRLSHRDLSFNPWFREAQRERGFVIGGQGRALSSAANALVAARAVPAPAGGRASVLFVELDTRRLARSVDLDEGGGTSFVVLDRRGVDHTVPRFADRLE